MFEWRSAGQRDGMATSGGTSLPPASSTRTLTPAASVSRLATTAPAEPPPTTMKSYWSMDSSSAFLSPLGGSLVQERAERQTVVDGPHVGDLAVVHLEVIRAHHRPAGVVGVGDR